MKAVRALGEALVATYYGLVVLGAIGNRSWALLAFLVAPVVVIAALQLRKVAPAFARARKEDQ